MLPLRSFVLNLVAPTRPCGRLLLASVAGAACPMAAHALQPSHSEVPLLEVRTELVVQQADASNAPSLAPQGPISTLAQRSTVWARHGAAAVGLGVQSRQQPGSTSPGASASATGGAERASLASPNLVVGMALETSARSRLVVDAPLLPAPRLDDSLNPAENGREVRVGLQIKPADPLKSLRAGQLFKLELSTRSQLALKPRSGGLMMSYSAKF